MPSGRAHGGARGSECSHSAAAMSDPNRTLRFIRTFVGPVGEMIRTVKANHDHSIAYVCGKGNKWHSGTVISREAISKRHVAFHVAWSRRCSVKIRVTH